MGVMRIKIGDNIWKEFSFEEGDGEAIYDTVNELTERVKAVEEFADSIIIEE